MVLYWLKVEVSVASFSSENNVFQYFPTDKVISKKVNFVYFSCFEEHLIYFEFVCQNCSSRPRLVSIVQCWLSDSVIES